MPEIVTRFYSYNAKSNQRERLYIVSQTATTYIQINLKSHQATKKILKGQSSYIVEIAAKSHSNHNLQSYQKIG